ncbi:hypothetical protein ARMGADRAFT_1097928, partial [Armillaria gallica]
MTSKLKLNGTVINKCWKIRRGLIVVIILLHGLTTINLAATWSYICSVFIKNEKNFWTAHLRLNSGAVPTVLAEAIASSMSTIITDLYMEYNPSNIPNTLHCLCPGNNIMGFSMEQVINGEFIAVALNSGLVYLSSIAAIARGVAPTLIIGRAAAGHTRPNDDDSENTVSSLHFQTASSEVGMTSFQESTIESTVFEIDIEAQQEQSDELVVVVERME